MIGRRHRETPTGLHTLRLRQPARTTSRRTQRSSGDKPARNHNWHRWAQTIGALATAGALIFTGLQAYSAQEQADSAQQQATAAQEQNLTQALGQSVEQLGSDDMSVRLLGIHTLGRVLRDSPQDRTAIAQGLAQFIREQGALPRATSPNGRPDAPADLDAALDALATKMVFDCDSALGHQRPYLHIDDYSPRYLASLQGTNLTYTALSERSFACADLSDADLRGAVLHRADLTDADLSDAKLMEANLQETDLSCARLGGANLTNAYLFGANLTNASLSGGGSVVTPCHVGAGSTSKANLRGADLTEANLSEADLHGVDLSTAKGVTQAQLDSACADEDTIVPAGLRRPPVNRMCPPFP